MIVLAIPLILLLLLLLQVTLLRLLLSGTSISTNISMSRNRSRNMVNPNCQDRFRRHREQPLGYMVEEKESEVVGCSSSTSSG